MRYKHFHIEVASPKLLDFITEKLENLGYKRYGKDVIDNNFNVSFINAYTDGDYQLCYASCYNAGEKMELAEFMALSKDDVCLYIKKENTKGTMPKHQKPNRRMSVRVKNERIYEIVKNRAYALGYHAYNGWYSGVDGVNFFSDGDFTASSDIDDAAYSRGLEAMSLSDFLSLKPEDCFVDLDRKKRKPCAIYDGNDSLNDDYIEFISQVHELLSRIIKGDVPDFSEGLCNNIYAYFDNPLVLSSFVCLSDWEYFSGSNDYPVPYCYGDPKQGFSDNKDKLWDKSTKYGQMRYKLCEWLLEQCELFLQERKYKPKTTFCAFSTSKGSAGESYGKDLTPDEIDIVKRIFSD